MPPPIRQSNPPPSAHPLPPPALRPPSHIYNTKVGSSYNRPSAAAQLMRPTSSSSSSCPAVALSTILLTSSFLDPAAHDTSKRSMQLPRDLLQQKTDGLCVCGAKKRRRSHLQCLPIHMQVQLCYGICTPNAHRSEHVPCFSTSDGHATAGGIPRIRNTCPASGYC